MAGLVSADRSSDWRTPTKPSHRGLRAPVESGRKEDPGLERWGELQGKSYRVQWGCEVLILPGESGLVSRGRQGGDRAGRVAGKNADREERRTGIPGGSQNKQKSTENRRKETKQNGQTGKE